ncbi:MAG: hypothetical protein PHW74_14980 [Desulfobacca sp.]|nr:hypothetical protein [Desulfobacca sp.]
MRAVREKYGDRSFTIKEIYEEVQSDGNSEIKLNLPAYLTGKSAKSLGRAFARQEGTYYGDRGLHLAREKNTDPYARSVLWSVKSA